MKPVRLLKRLTALFAAGLIAFGIVAATSSAASAGNSADVGSGAPSNSADVGSIDTLDNSADVGSVVAALGNSADVG
ncbi:hypothetical protein [Glycomyces buryatensis]|uniref:DUF320 domain-containing protein n=1 Tax=Glycomyces buryatensis TaxID=2570927 RepID=A0A4S8QD53_9ACTN|nr:hypothetical protein [Glycomyces buryatensis]THV42298.1 hypothetical protein FAB82_06460 [Glycomyces buryatensis]